MNIRNIIFVFCMCIVQLISSDLVGAAHVGPRPNISFSERRKHMMGGIREDVARDRQERGAYSRESLRQQVMFREARKASPAEADRLLEELKERLRVAEEQKQARQKELNEELVLVPVDTMEPLEL